MSGYKSNVKEPIEAMEVVSFSDLEFFDYLIDRGVKTFVAGDDDESIYFIL
jgi:hypothetical protein